jgi:hypothetical protein
VQVRLDLVDEEDHPGFRRLVQELGGAHLTLPLILKPSDTSIEEN